MRRDVFQAIADPTRRKIIHLVANQPLNMETVAENFKVSRSAIYKHIKILTERGLLTIRIKGRERFCEAKLENLGQLVEWAIQYRQSWHNCLSSLDILLNQSRGTNPPDSVTD